MKLVGYSAAAIEWAFGEYLARVGVDIYFPKPGQIIGLCRQYYDDRRQADESEQTKQVLRENADTRKRLEEAGEPSGLSQLHAILKRAMEINPMPTPLNVTTKRRNELKRQAEAERRKRAKS